MFQDKNHLTAGPLFTPMNAATAIRLKELYPPLAQLAIKLINQLAAQGIDVEVSQGLRTFAEQDALYAQGRTEPGRIVTHAKGGYSFHNFALAFDFFIQTAHGIDWTGDDASWEATIKTGEELGLVSGSEWHGNEVDRPHFQYGTRFGITPTDEVRSLYSSGGLPAVWAAIDTHSTSSDLDSGDL